MKWNITDINDLSEGGLKIDFVFKELFFLAKLVSRPDLLNIDNFQCINAR